MAQHLDYPAGDGRPPELPPSFGVLARRPLEKRRLEAIERVLADAGWHMDFDHRQGEVTVVDRQTGRRIVDSGRLCASYTRSGRPKSASVVRVFRKRFQAEVNE